LFAKASSPDPVDDSPGCAQEQYRREPGTYLVERDDYAHQDDAKPDQDGGWQALRIGALQPRIGKSHTDVVKLSLNQLQICFSSSRQRTG
jgi:hypothetical protein